MKLPIIPVHILTTNGLADKISSARSQVQDVKKLPLEMAERRLLEALFENRRLKRQVQEQGRMIIQLQKKNHPKPKKTKTSEQQKLREHGIEYK